MGAILIPLELGAPGLQRHLGPRWPGLGTRGGSHPASSQLQPDLLSSSLSYLLGVCIRFLLEKLQSIFEYHCNRLRFLWPRLCFVLLYSPSSWHVACECIESECSALPLRLCSGMPCLPPLSLFSDYSYYRMCLFPHKIVYS